MKRLVTPLATLALLVGLTIIGNGTAYARDYSGDCSGAASWSSSDGQGNASISDPGTCVISGTLKATGSISISALNGTVTTQDLNAGTSLSIVSSSDVTTQVLTSGNGGDLTITSSGNIMTAAINASGNLEATTDNGNITFTDEVVAAQNGSGGNMLFKSSANFQAQATLTTLHGGIEIDANTAGGNTDFRIGSVSSNGIFASLHASNGTYIVNGTSSSTGGITIDDGSDIDVNPQNGHAGLLLLNAQNGTLTLSAGTLSSDGAPGQDAGWMILLANTVVAGDNTTMTASQDTNAPAYNAPVGIAASTITIQGTTGLAIHTDDLNSSSGAQVSINPQGWLSITSTGDFHNLGWTISVTGTQNAPLTFNGTGNLTMTANGVNSQVQIGGYPIKFNNGAVTAQSRWDSSTLVNISNPSPYTGSAGVQFNNSGPVVIDASADTSQVDAGQVQMFMDQFQCSAPSIIIRADAANGTGGTVDFFPSTSSFSSATTTTTVSANGDIAAGTVNFEPSGASTIDSAAASVTANGVNGTVNLSSGGNLSVNSSTSFTVSANAPSAGGIAGTVNMSSGGTTSITATTVLLATNGVNGTLNFQPSGDTTLNSSSFSATANAPTSGGNAGMIQFSAGSFTLGASTNPVITANGPTSGTGAGGAIIFSPGFFANLSLGNSAGEFSLAAKGGSSGGNGGTLDVEGDPFVTVDTAQSTALDVSVPGGTGNGGTIIIDALSIDFNGSGYGLNANAGTSGGQGGTIDLTAAFEGLTVGNGAGAVELTANGAGSSKGGTISLTGTPLTVNGGFISVAGGSTNGTAGNITLSDVNGAGSSGAVTVTGTLSATGNGSGNGGSISLTGDSLSIDGSQILADGGPTGNSGPISLTSTGTNPLSIGAGTTTLIRANNNAAGTAGALSITSPANIVIGSNATINTNASTGNAAGNIGITATSPTNSSLEIDGLVEALGGASGTGGTINLRASASSSSPVALTVNGTVDASGSSGKVAIIVAGGSSGENISIPGTLRAAGTGSSIIAETQDGDALNVVSTGMISAAGGTVTFNEEGEPITLQFNRLVGDLIAEGSSVSVTGTSTSATGLSIKELSASSGNLSVTTTNVTTVDIAESDLAGAAVSASGNITFSGMLGLTLPNSVSPTDDTMFAANGNITLSTNGTGIVAGTNISAPSGTVSMSASGIGNIQNGNGANVIANTLTLQTQLGEIENSDGSSAFQTQVGTLNISTSGGDANIANSGSGLLTISSSSVEGSLLLETSASLEISSSISAQTIGLNSGNQLTVDAFKSIQSTAGDLSLTATNTIFTQGNNSIEATGGNLTVAISGSPIHACNDPGSMSGPSCRPSQVGVPTVKTGGALWWPAFNTPLDIQAAGAFTVSATNNKVVQFNASASSSIQLSGGEAFSAH